MWVVYLVRCAGGTYYTGITTDITRRLRQHNTGRGGAYTRAHRPVTLMYQERHPSRSSALTREAQIKGWPRAQKARLRHGSPCHRPVS